MDHKHRKYNLISIATKCYEEGLRVVHLEPKKKVTYVRGWPNTDHKIEETKAHVEAEGNLGLLVGADRLVIDVDTKEEVIVDGVSTYPAEESLDKLRRDTGLDLEVTVYTPGGGYHIYFRNTKKTPIERHQKNYPGIEFITGNFQCVMPGSVVLCETTNEQRFYYLGKGQKKVFVNPPEMPESLRTTIETKPVSLSQEAVQKSKIPTKDADTDIPPWFYREVLGEIDANMPYTEWFKTGAGLYHWGNPEGFSIWKEWSKTGRNDYKPGCCEKQWKKYTNDTYTGEVIGIGTLIHMAASAEHNIHKEDRPKKISPPFLKKLKEKVEAEADAVAVGKPSLTEKDLKEKILSLIWSPEFSGEDCIRKTIAPAMLKYDVSDIQREQIAKLIQKRMGEVCDTKVPIQKIRQTLHKITTGSTEKEAKENQQDALLEAVKHYVYSGADKKYVNTKTMEFLDIVIFDTRFGKYVPSSQMNRPLASNYLKTRSLMQTVACTVRLPMEGRYVHIRGESYALNTYGPESHPTPAEEHTPEGLRAIERIRTHCNILTAENDDLLLSWIAHQIQHPGRIIGWMPIVISYQGLGKTYIGRLLITILGKENVGLVTSEEMFQQFNGVFGEGYCSLVVEELKSPHNSPRQVMNRMKEIITNSDIRTEKKFVDRQTSTNTANLIGFTNENLPLPLEQSDRRYCILTGNIRSKEALHTHPAYTENYYKDLFEDLETYGSEICKWFREKDIDDFLEIRNAPVTEGKRRVIFTGEARKAGYLEIQDMLEDGGVGYNSECVCPSVLLREFQKYHKDIYLTLNTVHGYLIDRGYSATGLKIRIPSLSAHQIRMWTRSDMTNDEIRLSLERSEKMEREREIHKAKEREIQAAKEELDAKKLFSTDSGKPPPGTH